jgi:hypothetical protein
LNARVGRGRYRKKYIILSAEMSHIVSFTSEQYKALIYILNNIDHDEARWVEEHYNFEEDLSDTSEEILKKLDEAGVDADCTYKCIHEVRMAMKTLTYKVEEPQLKKEDVMTEEQFIKQMDKVGQSWKELAGMLYNRMPSDELAELAEEWKEEKEEEEDDEEDENEDCPGFIEDYDWVECCDSGCKHTGHWYKKKEVEVKEKKEEEAKEQDKEETKWRAMIDGVAATEEEEEEEEIELEEGEELCDKCGVMLEPDNDTICEGLCNWCAK